MNIHEYQAKDLLKKYGVSVQGGIVADTPDRAVAAAKELQAETGTKWFVVKSQIHAGGRGKGTVNETGSKDHPLRGHHEHSVEIGQQQAVAHVVLHLACKVQHLQLQHIPLGGDLQNPQPLISLVSAWGGEEE